MPVSSSPSPEELESKESSTEHETTGSKACESEEDTEKCSSKTPTLINQSMIKGLVRDLIFTKDKAVNLLETDTKISKF